MSSSYHRALVRGLQDMGPVAVRGQNYEGAYLSLSVAVNPELSDEEKRRTSQLISELGRITAAANYEREMAEVRYRQWREGVIHEMTNDLEAAENAGFASVCEPGQYASGKDKAPALPSKASVESYLRTLPEYADHKEAIAKAEEAWSTLFAAYEAAKSRQWTLSTFERSGGASRVPSGRTTSYAPDPPPPDGEDDLNANYFADAEPSLEELEEEIAGAERTPLPPPPPNMGPPGATPNKSKGPPAPPPPPTKKKKRSAQ